MNKVMKIVSVLLMVVMLTATLSTMSFATLKPGDIESGTASLTGTDTTIKNIGKTILDIIRNIAAILLVVLLAVLGIKFMMGSTEEKAEYKKSFIPLIVGTAIVLLATSLGGFIWNTF